MLNKLKLKAKKLFSNNEGTAGIPQLVTFAGALIVLGVFIAIGLYILSQIRGQIDDANSSAAINETIAAIAEIPGWMGILVVVVMAVTVLALVGGLLAFRYFQGQR